MALMWRPTDPLGTGGLVPGNYSFKFGDTNLTPYIDALTMTPAKVADNPHAPGTPEHREWEQANVHNPRMYHGETRRAAKATADERLANLKATYMRRGSAPTFAYGKGVDDLLAFIADDEADDPDKSVVQWIDEVDWDRVDRIMSDLARRPFTLPGGIA